MTPTGSLSAAELLALTFFGVRFFPMSTRLVAFFLLAFLTRFLAFLITCRMAISIYRIGDDICCPICRVTTALGKSLKRTRRAQGPLPPSAPLRVIKY